MHTNHNFLNKIQTEIFKMHTITFPWMDGRQRKLMFVCIFLLINIPFTVLDEFLMNAVLYKELEICIWKCVFVSEVNANQNDVEICGPIE